MQGCEHSPTLFTRLTIKEPVEGLQGQIAYEPHSPLTDLMVALSPAAVFALGMIMSVIGWSASLTNFLIGEITLWGLVSSPLFSGSVLWVSLLSFLHFMNRENVRFNHQMMGLSDWTGDKVRRMLTLYGSQYSDRYAFWSTITAAWLVIVMINQVVYHWGDWSWQSTMVIVTGIAAGFWNFWNVGEYLLFGDIVKMNQFELIIENTDNQVIRVISKLPEGSLPQNGVGAQ